MNRKTRLAAATVAMLIPMLLAGAETREEITKEKILAAGAEWREKYDKFEPEADMVDALKTRLGPELKIDVYLGFWCSDSRENLPPFIKLLDRAGTGVAVRYFDVPRKVDKETKYFVEESQVEKVPTFIFYRNGSEIGRIIENPKTSLIEDMMEILFR